MSLMRSISLKITLVLVVVSLIGTLFTAFYLQDRTRQAFDTFIRDQDQDILVAALTEHYQTNIDKKTYKGHFPLIECWPDVIAKVPGARLQIVGDGPGRTEVQCAIKKSSAAEYIDIAGFVPDDQMDEIWKQTKGSVSAFVHTVGTAHSIHGTTEALWEHNRDIKIVAVEPAESAVLSGQPAGAHNIEGIGIGFIPPLWEPDNVNEILTVSTYEAKAMARRLAQEFVEECMNTLFPINARRSKSSCEEEALDDPVDLGVALARSEIGDAEVLEPEHPRGQPRLFLEGHRSYFGTGSDLLYSLDAETMSRHSCILDDVCRAARLCDALPNIEWARTSTGHTPLQEK